jgi:hypothetical protein
MQVRSNAVEAARERWTPLFRSSMFCQSSLVYHVHLLLRNTRVEWNAMNYTFWTRPADRGVGCKRPKPARVPAPRVCQIAAPQRLPWRRGAAVVPDSGGCPVSCSYYSNPTGLNQRHVKAKHKSENNKRKRNGGYRKASRETPSPSQASH